MVTGGGGGGGGGGGAGGGGGGEGGLGTTPAPQSRCVAFLWISICFSFRQRRM